MRIKQAAEYLGVTTQTVRNYVNQGKLECSWTPSGQRIFTKAQLQDIYINKIEDETETLRNNAYYVRISRGAHDSIKKQVEKLEQEFDTNYILYSDKSSGINENRKGLQRLINDAREGKIKTIYITSEDRLARFGFKYLEELFKAFDVDIVTINEKENKEYRDKELLKDFMAVVTSFAGRLFNIRGYKNQRKLLDLAYRKINDLESENERKSKYKNNTTV